MSNNPNNTEIFMPENKSNKASIIVAVVAICLILGGVYLINQGVSSSNSSKETAQNTTTNSSSSNPAKPSSTSSNSPVEPKPDTTNAAPTTTTNPSAPTTPTVAPTPTTPAPTTTPAAPIVAETKLTPNQLTAKVISIKADKGTEFAIIECGIVNAVVCKSPRTFTLTGVKAIVDKVYLVTGKITDDGKILTLENITIKEVAST